MNTRRFGYFTVSLLTGSLLLFGLFCWLGVGRTQAHSGDGTLRYVASAGYCGGAAPCYSTIQAAVDASSPGDEIRVAAGAYTDLNGRPRADLTSTGIVTQVIYISKTITLRGGYLTINRFADPPDGQANLTLIDARQHGRGLYITGNISPTIENLAITGGYPSRALRRDGRMSAAEHTLSVPQRPCVTTASSAMQVSIVAEAST